MPSITRRSFVAGAGMAVLSSYAWRKARKIPVGVCSRDVANAVKFGFDYIEPAAADIAAMTDDQFREFRSLVLNSSIRCRAFNSLIRRPDLKVVGDDVKTAALRDYLANCFARCREPGSAIAVWGSAGSRNVPNGFSREKARGQIADFLRLAGDIARQHEMVVAIEPLRRQESNILNTGAEALEMVRRVNHKDVRMIIDYYHLREENEDPAILETARREVVHLHFANPHGRTWPHTIGEDAGYESFFRILRKARYSGALSIEGRGSFDVDAAASLDFLRRALS